MSNNDKNRVTVRFNDDEYKYLMPRVNESNMPISTFIKNCCLNETNADTTLTNKNIANLLTRINYTLCKYQDVEQLKTHIQMEVDEIWQYLK